MIGQSDLPEGLIDSFWAYERALMVDDVTQMDELFAPGPRTLRGDGGGLLVGHDEISAFRRARGGAPERRLDAAYHHTLTDDAVLVVVVTESARGGRGLQTQLWRRHEGRWQIAAAHVSAPPTTFDPTIWRVVGDPLVSATRHGPLAGTSIAVEDLIAVSGLRVGAGHPVYLAEARIQPCSAPLVDKLLAAGACLRGIARTTPLGNSNTGVNPYYGTPVNATTAAALPGSATATAVALGAASLGVLRDSATSTLLSATYQDLWGIRLSNGLVSLQGVVEYAPDFDSVGLLSKSPDVLGAAVQTLSAATRGARGELTDVNETSLDLDPVTVRRWSEAFTTCELFKIWSTQGRWISAHADALDPVSSARMKSAAAVTAADAAAAASVLETGKAQLAESLGDRVLSLDWPFDSAPRIWADTSELARIEGRANIIGALAALAGQGPLVVVPAAGRGHERLSSRILIGRPGADLKLVELALKTS